MNYHDKTKEELLIELQELQKKYNSLYDLYNSDITKGKQAEESLNKLEERQRFILESLPVAIYSSPVNPDCDTTWISGDVKKITGFEVSEYLSENDFWRKRLHPDDQKCVLDAFVNLPLNKETTLEYRWLCKDNQYHWFQDRSVLLENNAHKEYLGVIVDITERKQFEEELIKAKENTEENEKRFNTIIQSQVEGISFVNQNEIFEFANLAADRIFETETGLLTGTCLFDFLIPAEKEKIIFQSQNRKNKITNTYDIQIITKKGNSKYLQVSATPKFDENGIYLGAYGVFRDITNQKLAEKALALQNESFSKLNQFSIELAKLSSEDNLEVFISKKIKDFTGATGVVYSAYNNENKTLSPKHIELEQEILQKVFNLLGKQVSKISSPVNDEVYKKITKNIIGIYGSLTESSFGAVSIHIGALIQKIIRADRFIGVAFLIEGKLFGSTLLAMGKHQPDPPKDMLENFAFLAAVSLRRKRAEEALRESEEKYKVITQSTLDVIFIIDKLGKQLFFNKSVEIVLGYKAEEQVGKSFTQFVPRNQLPSYFSALKNVFPHKEVSNFVTQIYHKDGHLVDVEINGKIVKLNGKEVGLGTIRDITERKQSDRALQLAKESYFDIFNSVSEAIYVMDEAGTFIDVNKGAEKMYMLTSQELIGKNPADVAASDRNNIGEIQQMLKKVAETGESAHFDFWAIRKNGEVFPKEVIVNRGKYFEKNVLIATARDITEKKFSEEQLKLKNKELIIANADKDRFMSILAHDLKSPFNSILGFLQLLSLNIRNYDIDKIEKQISIINKSAQSFYSLLEDLLLWARSQSGKIPFEPQKIRFRDICNDIMGDIKIIADSKNITVNHLVAEGISVFADRDMLKTIMRNLISNAIKFTLPNGNITIASEKNENEVIISVHDTGIGISKSSIEKLFRIDENFTTPGTMNEQGTGLGLIICKEFIEMHGGEIIVESEEGKGSTFRFSLKGLE